jgi:hypothetical protein
MKSMLLYRLVGAADGTEAIKNAVRTYAKFLAFAEVDQKEHTADWLYYVSGLLKYARGRAAVREAVLSEFARSKSAALNLYGELERRQMLGRP